MEKHLLDLNSLSVESFQTTDPSQQLPQEPTIVQVTKATGCYDCPAGTVEYICF